MSIQVSGNQEIINRTVDNYLSYMLDRKDKGIAISQDEEANTYKYYKEFCFNHLVDFVSPHVFKQILTDKGILTKMVWDRNEKKTSRIRDFSLESLRSALFQWVDNTATHTSILEIDGQKYHVIVRLIKVSDAPEETSTEPSEIEVE